MLDRNNNKEMIEAITLLAKEKGINMEILFTAVEEALKNAYKNNFNRQATYTMAPRQDSNGNEMVRYRRSQGNANIRVELDRSTGAVHIYARKTVVAEVEDDANEISLEEARRILPTYAEDDIVEVEVTPKDFRRVAAQTAKQVFMQKMEDTQSEDADGEDDNEQILKMYKEGYSEIEIAKKLGKGLGEIKLVLGLFDEDYTA